MTSKMSMVFYALIAAGVGVSASGCFAAGLAPNDLTSDQRAAIDLKLRAIPQSKLLFAFKAECEGNSCTDSHFLLEYQGIQGQRFYFRTTDLGVSPLKALITYDPKSCSVQWVTLWQDAMSIGYANDGPPAIEFGKGLFGYSFNGLTEYGIPPLPQPGVIERVLNTLSEAFVSSGICEVKQR